MNGRQFGPLLGLLVYAVVHIAQRELSEQEEEHQQANDLVCSIEIS